MKIDQVVTESLADEFAAMARAKGMNVRVHGTPDEERARSQQILAQRAADREKASADAASADLARLPELKAELEQMKAEYDSLGGSNWQYADREQNLTDRERQARSMEHGMNALANRVARAEKSQGVAEASNGSTRAVDSKGRTQREWINLIRSKFPEAKIVQSKMIDGPVHAVLPDGRKTSWSPSVEEARASSASFRSSNARRAELNAMSSDERKAHDDKRAEQQRKRDDARLARERVKNVAEATMTPDQVAAAKAAAPYGYNPQTGKPNPAPAAAAPATAPAQPAATPTAPAKAAAPADPVQAATQSTLDKLGARAGAAPGSNTQQVADAYEQKILDRMGKRFGLPPGSTAEQVQAAQQAYLDKNDPAAAAQYKQQMSNIDADQPAGPAVTLAQPYSKDNAAAAGAQVQGKPAPTTPAQAASPATVPGQAAPAEPSLGADFDAGLAAQKAGGSPVDIMLAQPAIAGNQKLVDAIGSAYGLPPGSSVEQVKAAAKGKTAAPAIEEAKKKEKEADYGDDYQDMVARVKKLAGLGPLKTVYDPQKRVYKNIPTAVQPKK